MQTAPPCARTAEPGADAAASSPATSVTGPLIIHGAGGHGRAVAEAATLAGAEVIGFLDEGGAAVPGFRCWTDAAELPEGVPVHVAIGATEARFDAFSRHLARERPFGNVIHPAASVSPSAVFHRSVYVGPLAVVGAGCSVRDAVILNSGSILEHGGSVGPFSHLAPGVVTGGGVRIDDRTLVGLGSRVLPGLRLGGRVTVGAGSVVLRDVADGETVHGVVR